MSEDFSKVIERTAHSVEISNTAMDVEKNKLHSSLHQYYQNVMGNTEISSIKVEKAVKFLLLPEISKIAGDHTKATFLLSKGLTHDEVSEAFKFYYLKQKESIVSGVPEVILHKTNGVESTSSNAVQLKYANDTQSRFSIFFNLCQRVMVFAGISTAFYYLYQKWRSDKAKEVKSKKEHKRIEEELCQIKSELQRINAELKLHQVTGKTNANLAAEINSLKTILVSRQHFEELPNAKVSLPSWQLNASSISNGEVKNVINASCNNAEVSENATSLNNSSQREEAPSKLVETRSNEKNIKKDNQGNVETKTKGIANGDCTLETGHKAKKITSKNKNSKSKLNENGKGNEKPNDIVEAE